MTIGERSTFVVRPAFGYEDRTGEPFPPNSTLIFEIHLLSSGPQSSPPPPRHGKKAHPPPHPHHKKTHG